MSKSKCSRCSLHANYSVRIFVNLSKIAHFTARQRSCGKVMFSQVYVILFRGSRVSLVSGPFLIPDPMSFLGGKGVGYLWPHVPSGGRVSLDSYPPPPRYPLGLPYPLEYPVPATSKTGGAHPTAMLSCYVSDQITFNKFG